MSNILDIHISRAVAGDSIPFDKLYLVLPEHKDLIPRIFGYALVMPFTEDIKKALYTLHPETLTHKRFQRDDLRKEMPITPVGSDGVLSRTKKGYSIWWDTFSEKYQMEKRLVVVPVLTSVAGRKIRPRYLANQKWFGSYVQNKTRKRLAIYTGATEPVAALSEFAYLATPRKAPQDKIRPLCAICPRLMLHIQGKCTPGELVCYSALNFNDIPEESDVVSV